MDNFQLIPVLKAAEEFGVNRQTIINWHDEGLLQGAVIKGNRFVTRESLDKLKTIYPEIGADATDILNYKEQVEKERKELKELTKSLQK